ncbi:MAG: hypothetical protein DA408_06905 [Bacteroidetes bacterium]|nr:MAG: hypothetical protein C7N36_17175 [Bacteroidota bacterium]PTM13434.1 MAG: hypothetical protein DA408_06905 [Bacteroidota bacterium]
MNRSGGIIVSEGRYYFNQIAIFGTASYTKTVLSFVIIRKTYTGFLPPQFRSLRFFLFFFSVERSPQPTKQVGMLLFFYGALVKNEKMIRSGNGGGSCRINNCFP